MFSVSRIVAIRFRQIVILIGSVVFFCLAQGATAQSATATPDTAEPQTPTTSVAADAPAALAEALAAFEAFEMDRSLQLLEEYESEFGPVPESLHRRARIASFRAQIDVARAAADDCVARFPDVSLCHEALGESAILAVLIGGNPFSLLSATRTTRAAWEQAVELDPDNARAQLLLLAFYRQAPWMAGGSEKKARAIERHLKKSNPPKGLEAAGYNALYDEDLDQAVLWFGQAHQALPDDRDPHWNYASALSRNNQWPEAFDSWSAMTARYPQMWRAWLQRGLAAAEGGLDPVAARDSIQRFLDEDHWAPDRVKAPAHYGFGLIHEHAQEIEEAREQFRIALTLHPEHEQTAGACERVSC